MMRIRELVVFLALICLVACGGSGAADPTRPGADAASVQDETAPAAGEEADENPAAAVAGNAAGESLSLRAVRFHKEKFYVNEDLQAEVEVAPPVPDGVTFEFKWYIDNQEVPDVTGPVLEKGTFRKHQWIICQARATAGDQTSLWLKSDWVRAADSPPQIETGPIGNFNIPGRFSYQVRASDVDGDKLAYQLLSPLNLGIELDEETGLLTWNIDRETVGKVGDGVQIAFSVSDNDAPPSTAAIELRFTKRTQKAPL